LTKRLKISDKENQAAWLHNTLTDNGGMRVINTLPDLSEITGVLMPGGKLTPAPADELRRFNADQLQMFCTAYGIYQIPTIELIDFLRDEIGGEKTVEIGAGNGVIAAALDITATDSYQQARPDIKAHMARLGAVVVSYGERVLMQDAARAMKIHKPKVILGCWVTHKWNPKQPERNGNEWGIDEAAIIRRVRKYIFVGNSQTHAAKPILELPHREINPDWLFSRAEHQSLNRIWIWRK